MIEWIRCFDSEVAKCLFVLTSQPTNDRKDQSVGLDTNQVALI